MIGKAVLEVPARGGFEHSLTEGLSDRMALCLGRTFAMTLSEQDGNVKVTLESGETRVIGSMFSDSCDLIGDAITAGRKERSL